MYLLFHQKTNKKPVSEKKKQVSILLSLATPLSYPYQADVDRKFCVQTFRIVCPSVFLII
jgi:hypothetical protein